MFKTLRVEEESILQGLVGRWRDGTTPVGSHVHEGEGAMQNAA
jgi:hypothetical protein